MKPVVSPVTSSLKLPVDPVVFKVQIYFLAIDAALNQNVSLTKIPDT